jgi:hypothetical protein
MTTPAMMATKDVVICREDCSWTLYRKFKCFRNIQPDQFRVIEQHQDKKLLYAACAMNDFNIVFAQPGHSELEANKPLSLYGIKLNDAYLSSYDIEREEVKSAAFTKNYNLAANFNKTQANRLLDIFIDSFHRECRLAVLD